MNGLPAVTLALAVPLAWAINRCLGEPVDTWHPVAWLGHLYTSIGRRLSGWRPAASFVGGALTWLFGAGVIGGLSWAAQTLLLTASPWLAAPVLALLLKPTFTWRMLRDEAAAVESALEQGVEAARNRLGRLVSRDVAVLDIEVIRETTIETLAENLNDSLIAPLFWYTLFGLPGAAIYRFANTLDAMWGYRGLWEWSGKWSARADDVLSWLPARLTALLLMPTPRLWVEARVTPSPNSGWPMGAMALWLGVRLRKPGVYVINGVAPSPHAADVRRALAHVGRTAGVATVLTTASWLLRTG